MIELTRPPARIAAQGTFPLHGIPGASYTIGHDVVSPAGETLRSTAPGMLAVDIEGCGKDGRKRYDVKAVIIGTSEWSVIFDPRDPYQFRIAYDVINSGDYLLDFHNSPFDVPILHAIGLMELATISRVVDTLLWARLAEPDEKTRKTLSNSANRHLGMELSDPLPGILKTLGITRSTWYETKDLDTPAYRIMAATDVILTHRLVPAVKHAAYVRLTEGHPFVSYGVTGDEALRLVDREQIINRIHLRRQCKGYLVDPEYLDTYRADTAVRLQEWETDLEAESIAPGNSGSLTTYLESNGLLPEGYPRTAKTGKPSGEKANLKLITHPIAETFVQHKETRKLLDDYLSKVMDNSDDDGRIHPGTNILGAATGRQSISGDAPLHQFPAGARGIILADDHEVARAGMRHPVLDANGNPHPCTCANPRGMVSIDWSQIEPVVVANIAGDLQAIERYESGEKFYDAVASFAGIPYKTAKVVLLAQLYGEGITKLANDLRITVPEARKIVDLIWATLPGTRKLVDKAWKGGKLQSIAQEYRLVFTLSGRIVPVPSGWWPCWEGHESQDEIDACHKCNRRGLAFSVATHKGVNYFVQGSAYDLLAEAEVEIDRQGLSDAFYLAMHDELVVDAQAAHDVRKIMETPPARLIELAKRTPILRTDMAHLGERWAAA